MRRPEQPAVVDEFGLSAAALITVTERHLRRDDTGKICESTGQIIERVATFGGAEELYRPGAAGHWGRTAFRAAAQPRAVKSNCVVYRGDCRVILVGQAVSAGVSSCSMGSDWPRERARTSRPR